MQKVKRNGKTSFIYGHFVFYLYGYLSFGIYLQRYS